MLFKFITGDSNYISKHVLTRIAYRIPNRWADWSHLPALYTKLVQYASSTN